MSANPHNASMPLDRQYIKTRREELGLSQQQCADAAGLSNRAKWCDLETGDKDNPTLKTLEGICRALRCPLSKVVKS